VLANIAHFEARFARSVRKRPVITDTFRGSVDVQALEFKVQSSKIESL